jgi:biotin synthase-like enzyme
MKLKTTCFERALFFSWYCSVGDCKYCYMSTQPREKIEKKARRTTESLLAEVILCRKLGWELGFVSGGQGAYKQVEFVELLKNIKKVHGKKVWINIGALSKPDLIQYKPYVKGVVAAVETVNPKVHAFVCPSKPVKPFEKMLVEAKKLGLRRGMTIILGIGETLDDFDKLKQFIRRYGITKIHIYGLNPQRGTVFENAAPPSAAYQAEWIRRTRKAFPNINIQAGIWLDRADSVAELLQAGANSISKFPALKSFGSNEARELEKQAKIAGREFMGTLTKMPRINWDKEVDKLDFDNVLKSKIKKKLRDYLKKMMAN